MDASIIIVNFNAEKLLDDCVNSIINSHPKLSYEIIIVDNGSSYDVSVQVFRLKKINPQVPFVLIQNEKNIGFGPANNIGVASAKGKFVMFFNTDITVLNDAVTSLYKTLSAHDTYIVGGKLFNSNKTPQSSCGPFFSLPVVFTMLFLKGDTFGITRYSPDKIQKVDWVSGAFFGMLKDDFKRIGGFDPNLFMYMDEVELQYRASHQNIQTLFTPEASCIHLGSASKTDSSSPIINIYRGLLFFYRKHHSKYHIILLKLMLAGKAVCAIVVGKLIGNSQLQHTYEKAYQLVRQ